MKQTIFQKRYFEKAGVAFDDLMQNTLEGQGQMLAHFVFTRDEKKRGYLFAERSPEELIEILNRNYRLFDLNNCIYNNRVGVSAIMADCKVVRTETGFGLVMKGMDGPVTIICSQEDADQINSGKNVIYLVKEDNDYCVMAFSHDSGEFPQMILEQFLHFAGINTLHKLGKAINYATDAILSDREKDLAKVSQLPGLKGVIAS